MINRWLYAFIEGNFSLLIPNFFKGKSYRQNIKTPIDIIEAEKYLNIENTSSIRIIEGWGKMKNQLNENRQLYYFRSAPVTWENLCGREGIMLMEDDKVIDFITTMIN